MKPRKADREEALRSARTCVREGLWTADSSGTEADTRRLPEAGSTQDAPGLQPGPQTGRGCHTHMENRLSAALNDPGGRQTQTSTPWLTPQILCRPQSLIAPLLPPDQQRVGFLQQGPDPRVSLPATRGVHTTTGVAAPPHPHSPRRVQAGPDPGPVDPGFSERGSGSNRTNTLRPSSHPGP